MLHNLRLDSFKKPEQSCAIGKLSGDRLLIVFHENVVKNGHLLDFPPQLESTPTLAHTCKQHTDTYRHRHMHRPPHRALFWNSRIYSTRALHKYKMKSNRLRHQQQWFCHHTINQTCIWSRWKQIRFNCKMDIKIRNILKLNEWMERMTARIRITIVFDGCEFFTQRFAGICM